MDAIFTLEQIQHVAVALWKEGKQHKVWAFYAPMGSGKTTLIHAICKHLGVNSSISSPTFSIINQYLTQAGEPVYHMDWYRLKDETEAIEAGVEEMMGNGDICFIEWPEKAPNILPEQVFRVHIEMLDELTRRIFTSSEAAIP
jgi:tRNA threonylcarbamoyladenosine biosynthesis protein TsaE